MRIGWPFITGIFLLMQWKDVTSYYSDDGIFPRDLTAHFTRTTYRFTLLDATGDPQAVFALYGILLLSLFCMMIGLWPRLMTIISVLLLFSFHERSPLILGGGDTLLRTIGFLLIIAPVIEGFSVKRWRMQWAHWKKKRTLLPSLTMPIWPWRLLLWQIIILYATSLWYKLLGTMWLKGTAVEVTFHHPVFIRWPQAFMDTILPFAGIADYLALLWQGTWLLLLVPRPIAHFLLGPLAKIPLRRFLITGGILFHGGILIVMDAGIFSLAAFVAYIGLLRDEDFAWMKKILNRKKKIITVFYDGHCGLCQRSIFTLQLFDHLHRLHYANFRDSNARAAHAPDVTEKELDKSMHIKLQDGTYKKGFDAFRYMTWHLPALWMVAPFLYLPGVPAIGRRVYARIAAKRRRCDHESCALD